MKTIEEYREYTRLKVARWRAAHPERARAISRRQKPKRRTPEQERLHITRWRAAYPEKARAVARQQVLKKYGLTEAGYTELLARQAGVCAICGRPPVKRMLAIDHDHATGRVRGLLCGGCNQGLGHFQDDPACLLAAASYLSGERP